VAGAGTGNRIRSTTKKSRSSKHGNDKHRYPPAQETMEEVRMSSKNSVNERLAYYREKYGEDFKLAENNTTTGSKTEKESSPVNGKQRKGILARLFKKENLS